MRVHFSETDRPYEVPPEADRMSKEEFFEFCKANPELNLERDKDGTIELMAPVAYESGGNEMHAAAQLYLWNQKAKLGRVLSPSTGFTLPNGAVRSPDAAWVSQERHDALSEDDKKSFPRVCPDFVIEIRSSSDSLHRLKAKMEEYIGNGCRLGFLIDPFQQMAWVYAPGKSPGELSGFQQKLSGAEVLPGFELDLSVFASG
jgi:Uma2 family endonuclease